MRGDVTKPIHHTYNIDLYEADCHASTGRPDDACAKLGSEIAITSSMYDAYIRTLHVTLKTRFLEVRMWKQNFKEAIPLALDLACEVLDHRRYSTLAPDAIYYNFLISATLCCPLEMLRTLGEHYEMFDLFQLVSRACFLIPTATCGYSAPVWRVD